MKNLKRVLSLALAGTMLSGMMAMGASAVDTKDFTDKDEITHTEAVDVMSTLGVLKGKDTGAFDPKTTVTRAEMAKIICVMLNGGVDPTLGSGSTSKFTDTANHWARNYIEYCANLGVIAGQGDGTFAPDAPVTGAAAAKMLLVALGYDSKISGFTGADWDLNVNRIANTEAKLYEEIKGIDTSAGLSRDDTAQMAYNALEAFVMERTDHRVVGTDEVSYTFELSTNTTFLNKYFDAYTFIGQMVGNSDTQHSNVKGHVYMTGRLDTEAEGYYNNQNQWVSNNRSANFPSNLDISNIGEEIKVIFKDGKGGQANKPDKNDTIFGVFNTGTTQVINATLSDIKKPGKGPDATDKIKVNGEEYAIFTPAVNAELVRYNYNSDSVTNATDVNSDSTFDSADVKYIFENLYADQNGSTVKFVCNDNGEITNAYVVNTYISYITATNSSKVTINGVGTIEIDKNDVYEGAKKDDIVTYTKFYDGDKDKAFFTVKKAESVEGTLDGFKVDDDAYVNIVLDGKTYKTYGKRLASATIGNDATENAPASTDIGEKFTAYMVNGYVNYLIQDSDSANKVALITDLNDGKLGSTFDKPEVELLLPDGTKVVATVDKDSTIYDNNGDKVNNDGQTAINASNILEKFQIVRYSVTSGNTYKLVEVKTSGTTNGYAYRALASESSQVYDKDVKEFKGTVTAGDCVLFVDQKNTADQSRSNKVYSIRDLGNVTVDSSKVNYLIKDGKVIAAFIQHDGRPSGAANKTTYGLVTAYNGTRKVDDDTYKSYTVKNNEATYTLLMDDTSEKIPGTGSVVGFEPSNNDVYNDSDITVFTGNTYDEVNGLATWVKEFSTTDRTLTYYQTMTKNSDTSYTGSNEKGVALDDDCVIVYIDQDDGDAGDDVGISEFDSTTGYRNVLLIKDDSTSKVVGIVVESSREANVIDMGAKGIDKGGVKNTNDLKALGNGAFKPAKNDTDLAGVLKNVNGLADNVPTDTLRLIMFKNTTGQQASFSMEVYNDAGVKVYAAAASTHNDGATALWYFCVDCSSIDGATLSTVNPSDTVSGSWANAQKVAGTYTVQIKSGSTVVYTTTFTV